MGVQINPSGNVITIQRRAFTYNTRNFKDDQIEYTVKFAKEWIVAKLKGKHPSLDSGFVVVGQWNGTDLELYVNWFMYPAKGASNSGGLSISDLRSGSFGLDGDVTDVAAQHTEFFHKVEFVKGQSMLCHSKTENGMADHSSTLTTIPMSGDDAQVTRKRSYEEAVDDIYMSLALEKPVLKMGETFFTVGQECGSKNVNTCLKQHTSIDVPTVMRTLAYPSIEKSQLRVLQVLQLFGLNSDNKYTQQKLTQDIAVKVHQWYLEEAAC